MDPQDWHDVQRYVEQQLAQDRRRRQVDIEAGVRVGIATALESVAAVLEAGMEPTLAADLLREHAVNVEAGVKLGPPRLRLVSGGDVPAAPEGEQERDEQGDVPMQPIEEGRLGNAPILKPALSRREREEGLSPDDVEFSPEMKAWLDEFDDRIRMSPHFIAAVNEAAENGLIISEHTAQLVYGRVRELEAAAEAAGGR